MKVVITHFLLLFFVFCTCPAIAQGYFIANAGTYISQDNFKTNDQKDISKYSGKYIAVSETYESNYTFNLTNKGEFLNIVVISAGTMDGGENWDTDTTTFDNISVKNGIFVMETHGNKTFRFANVKYKPEGKNNYIGAEGIIMEEFFMFAEKE